MVALIRGLVRKFIRTTARSTGPLDSVLRGSDAEAAEGRATPVRAHTGMISVVRQINVQSRSAQARIRSI